MLTNHAADFSFGHTIGALDAYTRGTELDMIAKNDVKATWMPLVSSIRVSPSIIYNDFLCS